MDFHNVGQVRNSQIAMQVFSVFWGGVKGKTLNKSHKNAISITNNKI